MSTIYNILKIIILMALECLLGHAYIIYRIYNFYDEENEWWDE
jgi:hypothetical protein